MLELTLIKRDSKINKFVLRKGAQYSKGALR